MIREMQTMAVDSCPVYPNQNTAFEQTSKKKNTEEILQGSQAPR